MAYLYFQRIIGFK